MYKKPNQFIVSSKWSGEVTLLAITAPSGISNFEPGLAETVRHFALEEKTEDHKNT